MINMMKDCTILTFDEMEMIRNQIDNMIDNAKRGAYGEDDAKSVCDWLISDLNNFRNQFE